MWPVVDAVAFADMLRNYWFGNRPLNAQIATWTAETIPADWSAVRDRWDTAHTISAILAAIAFGSLLGGLLTGQPGALPSQDADSSSTNRSAARIQPSA